MKEKGIINIKELFKGIAIVCLYPLLVAIIAIPFSLLFDIHIISEQMFYLLTYICLLVIFIFIYFKDLKKDFDDLKKNYKKILLYSIIYWLIGLAIMLISSYLFEVFKMPSNVNQDANINQLREMPIFEILAATIIAPIIEELVFRRSLKDFTPNKHIYAIGTGLLFAFFHVYSSLNGINSLIMLLYFIPYGSLGIAFGYAYKKTNNIWGNIFIHMLHNTISIIELLFLI